MTDLVFVITILHYKICIFLLYETLKLYSNFFIYFPYFICVLITIASVNDFFISAQSEQKWIIFMNN